MLRTLVQRLKFELIKRFSTEMIRSVKLKEFSLFLDFKTPGISKMLYINGSREDDMIHLLKQHIPNFGDIVDCGSNIGFYPILEAMHTSRRQKIICIEPDSRNVSLLRRNIENYGDEKRHTVLPIAISDVDGDAHLDTSRASNLNFISFDGTSSIVEKVKVISFDSLVDEYKLKPSFIRMDIEGHELNVFRGAKQWAKNAPSHSVVLFETHAPLYPEKSSLYESLKYFEKRGFYCASLVSAGGMGEEISRKLGGVEGRLFMSDGFERTIFENVEFKTACYLASDNPKTVRYLLLKKA